MRERRPGQEYDDERGAGTATAAGKRTLTAALQHRAAPTPTSPTAAPASSASEAADDPFWFATGGDSALPHLDTVQRSFGRHDVTGVQAHVGGDAAITAHAMGASAYASGNQVGFASSPDLETAAHEAAHVVQQRGGVSLKGGIGEAGDVYERHADEVAATVVRGESAESLLDTMAGRGGTPGGGVQRKLIVTGDGPEPRTFEGEEGEEELRRFVAAATRKPLDDKAWNAAWTVGGLRRYKAAVRGDDLTVTEAALVDEAQRSAQLAQAIGGKGLPLFGESGQVTFGDEDAEGAKGYTAKMTKGLEAYLAQADSAVVTVGGLEDALPDEPNHDGLQALAAPDAGGPADRRPGLTILNYGAVYWDAGQKRLVICNVRGAALAEQFAMALIAHGDHTGRDIEVRRVEATSPALEKNYGRLTDFFAIDDSFRRAQTLVFGYKSSFGGDERFTPVAERATAGWTGALYRVGDEGPKARYIAALDSDNQSSYHGEILARNIQGLLASPGGAAIRTVLTGGSAGALVPSEPTDDGTPHLPPSSIYTPARIMGPDGAMVPNALAPHGQVKIPDSIHTSVVSALVETPALLQSLHGRGIQTIDMEFGYVAAVIQSSNQGRGADDQVQFGIACLVTDYPRTSSQTKLSEKKEDKGLAKKRFVDTIHTFVTA